VEKKPMNEKKLKLFLPLLSKSKKRVILQGRWGKKIKKYYQQQQQQGKNYPLMLLLLYFY
jgi:hypothetical protein